VSWSLIQKVIGANHSIDTLKDIVPLIIFLLIWVIAAIAKVAQKKGGQGEQKPQRPQRQMDFDEIARTIRQRYTAAREAVKKEAQGPAPIPQQTAQPRPMAQPQKFPQPRPAPSIQLPLRPQPEVTAPAMPQMPEEQLTKEPPAFSEEQHFTESFTSAIAAETHPYPYLAELANQYSDPDGLRKAILNYEILNLPLALREGNSLY